MCIRDSGDGAAQKLLHTLEVILLIDVAEGDSGAAVARSAGTADPVDIGLGHIGQVVVEHVGELFNIQTPGGDIGGHQDLHLPAFEVGEGLLPGGLTLVAVDGGGGDAAFLEVPGHLIGPVLGAGKDQGVLHIPRHEQRGEELGLVPPVHIVCLLYTSH